MGVGLIEVFEVDGGATPAKLVNIATRGRVDTGDDVMIGGFIIIGSSPQTVLLRAGHHRCRVRRFLCQEHWQIRLCNFFQGLR